MGKDHHVKYFFDKINIEEFQFSSFQVWMLNLQQLNIY